MFCVGVFWIVAGTLVMIGVIVVGVPTPPFGVWRLLAGRLLVGISPGGRGTVNNPEPPRSPPGVWAPASIGNITASASQGALSQLRRGPATHPLVVMDDRVPLNSGRFQGGTGMTDHG